MQPGPAKRELGCSRCRFSSTGCNRCRNPSFRPRTAVPREEMAQVVAAQRRQERATQQEVRREQRREAGRKTGAQQRELLLSRLRRQLGPEGGDQHIDTTEELPNTSAAAEQANESLSKRQRNTKEDGSPPHPEQPPAKFRKVAKESLPSGGNNINQLVQDREMDDIGDGELSPVSDSIGGGSDNEGSGMDIDLNLESPQESPRVQREEVKTREPASVIGTGTKRPFLDMLHDNMARRREARLSGSSPPSELLAALPSPKRQRRSPQSAQKSARSPHSRRVIDPRAVLWEPPVSPYGLIEEELFEDPWKLLVACLLLNKTSGTQVRGVIWDLFQLCPTPQAAIAADTQQLQDLIQPLGLFRKRAVAIQRFSAEYLKDDWEDVMDLHGIGKYAGDAYRIFCRGEWREVEPEDKDLKKYKEWLESTGGLGTGLTRSRTVGQVAVEDDGTAATSKQPA